MKNKKLHRGGRKPKKDPAIYRYSVSFNAVEHERFLALFEQSGMRTKAHFIVKRIFDEPFKVIHIDKPTEIIMLSLQVSMLNLGQLV